MKKQEFLDAIKLKLSWLPKNEVLERLNFYSEIIDDKIEEGIDEEVAVGEIGSIDEISKQIVKEIPLLKIAKEKIKLNRSLKVWEIIFIVLGFPIGFAIIASLFAVAISIYATIWAVIISLWAVFVSFIAGGMAGVILTVYSSVIGNSTQALLFLSATFALVGLSIFSYYVCLYLTKFSILLTKKLLIAIKNSFIKRRKHNEN